MYNKKKHHESSQAKPHYHRDENGTEIQSRPETPRPESGQKTEGNPSGQGNRDNQRRNNFPPRNNRPPRPEGSQNRPGDRPAAAQPTSQAQGGSPSEGGESRREQKNRNYWRNRRNKKRGDRTQGQNASSGQLGNQPNPQNQSQNQNRNIQNNQQRPQPQPQRPEPPREPVILPDDIQTLEPLEASILEFKPGETEEGPAKVICPICEQAVQSLSTAIWHKEHGTPAHFDCVVKELVQTHKDSLGKHRRIYYIGKGQFAIVKETFDKRGQLKTYQVMERIPYEHTES